MEWEDGNEYPVIRLDVSSDSHPFYTGRQNSQQRMVVWNVSTKVWTQIKQQLILDFNCLLSRLGIVDSFYYRVFVESSTLYQKLFISIKSTISIIIYRGV